ncbi:hypothetical protein AKJ43_01685 [candidate division MSBL1 archaeon SCGC-AAA261D19]|uniref:CAAX prenyl protease 2/Lysostaphin resistance protein A-like domain-containing protein n=1 Tax=candidate division MSBL1 archaeon SCGC-AAA261D19 TaxID=1698273 RepID=A0A133V7S6_9EURY|nr:hypothetical protein AKJ43_01685 [candidate division MSBL1 archaeon SCGC-AAA261D19]
MKERVFSKLDGIELSILIATYIAVTIMAFYAPIKIEWVWRVPQVILPFVIVQVRHESIKRIGLHLKNFFQNLGVGIATAALLTVGLAPIYLWLWPPVMPTSLYFGVWVWASLFIVTNAFVIELFYRGCLQPRLKALTGAMPALAITSLLCGLDFFEFMIFGPITAVLAAVAFGFLYYKTRSLVAPVAAHILWFLFVMVVVVST